MTTDVSWNLRRIWPWLAVILVIYLGLAIGRALTTYPWNDEAWYASPAWNLIHHGHAGTPLLETTHNFWQGINEWTYWVPPLHFYVQIPWFKLFGFSLLAARMQAIAWGLIALLAWGGIAWKFTADRVVAFGTMLLIALDYQFVSQTALARMDAMAIAFAALGILSYLHFRERNLTVAVLLSQSAVVACGISHPNPGVPAFVAVAVLALYYDRKRIGWRQLLIAVVPYIVGAAAWGLYISIAPQYFKAQFFGNVTDIDRLGGFKRPWTAFLREFERYATMCGFAPGMNPLYRIKIIVIVLYAAAIAVLAANRETRRDPRFRPLLLLIAAYFLTMAIYDNTKEVKYGFQIMPLYDAALAAASVWCWRRAPAWRLAVCGAVLAYIAVSAGGLLYTTAVVDAYHRSYVPMTEYLKTHAAPDDLIFASSETGFALGFDRNIVDDRYFGYYTGKVPRFLVVTPGSRADSAARQKKGNEPQDQYLNTMIDREFNRVYAGPGFEIYERRIRSSSL
jgi:4-amino-4-deoxy-L-arabinose transferase-like glycosyltransferase